METGQTLGEVIGPLNQPRTLLALVFLLQETVNVCLGAGWGCRKPLDDPSFEKQDRVCVGGLPR